MYSVYVLTVKDGRKYVGATSMNPISRWNHGNGYRFCEDFWEVICRDGWESVKKEIVADALTKQEASRMEQELISRFHSTDPQKGFNREGGGIDDQRLVLSSTRQKQREKQLGVLNNNYGMHFSVEHRRKIAESNRGRKRSEETKKRIGKAKSKPVFQYSMNGEFIAAYESGRSAEKITGIPAYAISKVCRGVHKQAGGYFWKN